MKKIFFAIAALAMVFAACDKTDLENDSDTIQLNITVADIGSDEPVTRASVKDAWDIGDQIYIWYDDNTGDTPDLVITYNGSEWKGPGSIMRPSHSSGYVKCVYDGRVKVASKPSYTFGSTTFKFSFNIDHWTCLSEIVVVVTDIPEGTDASDYTLACDKFTPLSGKGYTVGPDTITATAGTKSDAVTGFTSYIYNGAAAFVFATADYSDSEQNFLFTLTNTKDELNKRIVQGYSFNDTIAEGTTRIKYYEIADSSFQESVRLWDGGREWAYSNIGAESATGYGYYFAWGHTDGYVYNGSSWVKGTDPSSSITFDRTGYPDYKTHAYSDMARANWGAGWKVPEKTDFDNLLSKCTVEYVTTGAPGIKITGTGDYCANSIFIPAAGYCADSGLGSEGSGGFYYSATKVDSDNSFAYALYFYLDQSNTWVANNKKFCGRSVRPVRDHISFADENFKAYCVEHFDTNGDGEINQEEAQAVTAIDCSGKNIASLAGIEYFSNLETLNASGNTSLAALDVSTNTSLTKLNVPNTSLTKLNVSSNTLLTTLDCSNNASLTTLDVSGNTSLTTLVCDNGIHIIAGTAAKPISSISAQWAYIDDVKAVFFTFSDRVKAMAASEATRVWGYRGTVIGASSTTDGVSNTDKIVSKSSAAQWCRALGSMWYLPALDELITIYNNMSSLNSALALASGTQVGKYYSKYWASTEYDRLAAYVVGLKYYEIDAYNKEHDYAIRAVRSL